MNSSDSSLLKLKPPVIDASTSSQKIIYGSKYSPEQLIFLFSSNDWEIFITEWAHFQETKYQLVAKSGGANDFGVDVACFSDKYLKYSAEWDCYQCKYYKDPLTPTDAIPEIGKILWHIYNGNIATSPTNYYFFAPKDCGPKFRNLLLDSDKLKQAVFTEWSAKCSKSITKKNEVLLEGEFLEFFERFDFTIFSYKSTISVIEDHRHTPYYAIRFGGGLPDRKPAEPAPLSPRRDETRYIEQILEAYSDKEKKKIDKVNLCQYVSLEKHFNRQRNSFYSSEQLKAYSRDSVPAGTYDALLEDMYQGVVDVECRDHIDAYTRLLSVSQEAKNVQLTANALISVVRPLDRNGMCHQLANNDKLKWVKNNE